ncbi:MAG: LysM peptidoglycan-binding domain-containing protein [Pontiellaceae bacterium]|nr:LysM peptidoglycan-binding domain-containing protein [Pontiellaceae bacterium]
MKSKVIGLRMLVMHTAVLAGFSLMQGCTTGDSPIKWLNWPYSTPKDQPVVLPPGGADFSSKGLMPVDDDMPVIAPAASSFKTHRVQKGETLSTIAASYGTSWKKLADYNDLSNPNKLKIGQELRIPDSFGESSPVIKRPSSAPASARPASGSIKQGTTYTIQKGDMLSTIAKRSGLTVSEIKTANGMQDDRIVAGKKLTIPKKGEAKAPVAAKPVPAKEAPAVSAPVQTASPAPAYEPDPNLIPDEPSTVPSASPVASAASAPVYEHVLYPGETLEDVARQYGSSQQDIMKMNNITDPASIKPGMKLLVPIPN